MLITILPPHLHPLRRLSRVCSSDPSIQRVAETRAVHGWIAGKIFIGRDVFESLDQMRTIPALLYSSQAPLSFQPGWPLIPSYRLVSEFTIRMVKGRE
jgi:hypothetical protein